MIRSSRKYIATEPTMTRTPTAFRASDSWTMIRWRAPVAASITIMWPASMVAIKRKEWVSGRTMKLEMISSGTISGMIQPGTPEGTTASLK
ncbi:hypothetical protein D9M73_236990 [compost metagenome]